MFYTAAMRGRDIYTNAKSIFQLEKCGPPDDPLSRHLYKEEWGWCDALAKQKYVAFRMINKRSFNEPIYVHYMLGPIPPTVVDWKRCLQSAAAKAYAR